MYSNRRIPLLFAIITLLISSSCDNQDQQYRLELRKSFKNFLASVDEMHVEGLKASVYFPGETDYKGHVQELLLNYLDEAQNKGQITFDPQGVVLGRFLGLLHLSYAINDYKISEDGMNAEMRIAYRFSYDNNIAYDLKSNDYDPGTRILIPGKPFGKVITITLGEDVPTPREQLQYIEMVVKFRKTNHEGLWQVRECTVDEEKLKFEISINDTFKLPN